jgi:hypothetical protein
MRNGSYIVRVQVTDKDGAQAVAATTVHVAAYRVFLPMAQEAVGLSEQG